MFNAFPSPRPTQAQDTESLTKSFLQAYDELKKPADAIRASNSNFRLRMSTHGLNSHTVKEAAEKLLNHLLTEGIGQEGVDASLELAAAQADVLDAMVRYQELMDKVAIDVDKAHELLDPRTWAATPNGVRKQLAQAMLNHRSTMQKHFSKEVQNLELLIAHIDRVNPYALEQFERRRLKRRGLRARDIEREINQMKKDGRLKVAPAAND